MENCELFMNVHLDDDNEEKEVGTRVVEGITKGFDPLDSSHQPLTPVSNVDGEQSNENRRVKEELEI